MKVRGSHYRTIWLKENDSSVLQVIDQRRLPFEFKIVDLTTVTDVARAIEEMWVRGAGLIGATAGYGMYIAALAAPKQEIGAFLQFVVEAGRRLKATRPTAVNLEWAVETQLQAMRTYGTPESAVQCAKQTAQTIADNDAEYCRKI